MRLFKSEKWWEQRSRNLQESVSKAEADGSELYNYDESQVRVSAVHARQDLVLIVSLMYSLNEQIDSLNSQVLWMKISWTAFLCFLIYDRFFG